MRQVTPDHLRECAQVNEDGGGKCTADLLRQAAARIEELEGALSQIIACDGPLEGEIIGPLFMAGLSKGLQHCADIARAVNPTLSGRSGG